MAAELHRDARHAVGAQAHQMLADIGRAGEADLADDPAGDQRLADEARIAVDELGNAVRDAGVRERPEQLRADARSFVRRTRDDRAARGERGADLLREQIEREVPRRERCGRTDRLADHAAEAGPRDGRACGRSRA